MVGAGQVCGWLVARKEDAEEDEDEESDFLSVQAIIILEKQLYSTASGAGMVSFEGNTYGAKTAQAVDSITT